MANTLKLKDEKQLAFWLDFELSRNLWLQNELIVPAVILKISIQRLPKFVIILWTQRLSGITHKGLSFIQGIVPDNVQLGFANIIFDSQ